jgi:CHAT domain-containing protein
VRAAALLLALALTIVLVPAAPPALAQSSEAGVILLRVEAGSAFAEADVAPGDVLLEWHVTRAEGRSGNGRLLSVFDLFQVATEQVAGGGAVVTVQRDGVQRRVTIPPGFWLGDFFPAAAAADLQRFREASRLLDEDATAPRGRAELEALMRAAAAPLTRAWYGHVLAKSLRAREQFADADALTDEAARLAESANHPYAAGWLYQNAGIQYFGRQRPETGTALLERALATWEQWRPGTLVVAVCLDNLAIAANIRGEHGASRQLGERALAIRRAATGRSLVTAGTLHTLGNAAFWSDDLDEAERRFREALSIRQELDPGGMTEAQSRAVLANIHWRHGELDQAQALLQQTLATYRRLDVQSFLFGEILTSLGHIAHDRRDLAAAEDYRLQALEVFARAAPEGNQVADALLGLGNVAKQRGDFDGALGYYQRALDRYQAVQPDGQRVSLVLYQLGQVALEHQQPAVARTHLLESLRILEGLGARGALLASRHQALGSVALAEGRLQEARTDLLAALDFFTRRNADNLHAAAVHRDLARLALAEDNTEQARAALERSLEIGARLAPGTLHEAEPAFELARLLEDRGDVGAALGYYVRALDALEAQRGLLGGSDSARAGFEHRYGEYYRRYLRALLDLDDRQAAFDVLERYRARALLSLLSERRLILTRGLPEALAVDLQRVNWRYEQARDDLMSLEEDKIVSPTALETLRRLRSEREQLVRQAGRLRPAFAATVQPQPLSLDEVAVALPDDTALISFAVLEDATALFVLPAGPPQQRRLGVFVQPVGRERLRDAVHRLRLLIQSPGAGGASRMALDTLSRDLHRELVEPAEALLAGAARLLIVPDGPLHLLPFAALVAADGRYLLEQRAVNIALSATLFRQLSEAPAPAADAAIFAVGALPGTGVAAAAFPAARLSEVPLPHAAVELQSIRERFPGTVLLTGAQASETGIKALNGEARVLHFATHAVTDARSPLDSYLALGAAPADVALGDNGRLQAWEIYEQMQLNAGLVVLSACETGLGRDMGGEGLIGLTRAFQFAGAAAVLASLWPVSDASTASLMTTFYGHLQDGASQDDALRLAQLSLASPSAGSDQSAEGGLAAWAARLLGHAPPPDFRHPYYWAGFQLNGSGHRPLQPIAGDQRR